MLTVLTRSNYDDQIDNDNYYNNGKEETNFYKFNDE